MQNKNLQNLLKKVNDEKLIPLPSSELKSELIVLNDEWSNSIKGGKRAFEASCDCNGTNVCNKN